MMKNGPKAATPKLSFQGMDLVIKKKAKAKAKGFF